MKCQNTIGLPDVINYSKQAYKAGLQNWDIKQDSNGIIYIANNEGLLCFDGKYWTVYPLPNKTIVRSVEIGADNRIYAGGQDEFGYFSPGKNGMLEFTSLTGLMPAKDRSFGDVWDIVSYNKNVYFRTTEKVFKISNEKVSVFPAVSEWTYLGACGDKLYAHDLKNGLFYFENNAWRPIDGSGTYLNDNVTGILSLQKGVTIIATFKKGVYSLINNRIEKLSSPDIDKTVKDRIYAAIAVNQDWMALATSNGGVNIINASGALVQRFSKDEGLQNNNVLSIFLDKEQNLWLGLDNGVDFISYNSAIKKIIPDLQGGSGYAAIIYNNQLYAGTSGGLYAVTLQPSDDLSFSKGIFIPVANATGQTWGLAEINKQLLLGHHEGAFRVLNNTATLISGAGYGYWNFSPVSAVFPTNSVIAGNYKGLAFLNYKNEQFSFAESIPGFSESSRFVVLDNNNNIWVSHPYHGVFKVTQEANGKYKTKLYSDKDGLPSSLNNHIYEIKDEMLVATEKGIYTYNNTKDRFEVSAFYRNILGEQSIRYLKEDKEGNIWFVHEKNPGVIDLSGKEPVIIYLPELNNKLLSGFEFIYPVNSKNIFVSGEKGFFHINYEKYKKNLPKLQVHIRSVRISNKKDSLLFGGYFSNPNEKQLQAGNQVPGIKHKWGTIRIEFSAPLFGQQQNLEYSYRMKGIDNSWSEWSSKTDKEYTHLPAGVYTFNVKVRSNLGNESEVTSYTFRILPPWYQTIWAYIIYAVII
ncbi:MAG TPA: triple tyrosine motif-containing protein, partial [Chitinophagaceae bacterium]|nr:triple tyrosine motif-containing protein [Chitinophagaceae bacterium]